MAGGGEKKANEEKVNAKARESAESCARHNRDGECTNVKRNRAGEFSSRPPIYLWSGGKPSFCFAWRKFSVLSVRWFFAPPLPHPFLPTTIPPPPPPTKFSINTIPPPRPLPQVLSIKEDLLLLEIPPVLLVHQHQVQVVAYLDGESGRVGW